MTDPDSSSPGSNKTKCVCQSSEEAKIPSRACGSWRSPLLRAGGAGAGTLLRETAPVPAALCPSPPWPAPELLRREEAMLSPPSPAERVSERGQLQQQLPASGRTLPATNRLCVPSEGLPCAPRPSAGVQRCRLQGQSCLFVTLRVLHRDLESI